MTELEIVLKEFRSSGQQDYGTHLLPLILAVMNTRGPILEMGSGLYSTRTLHHVSKLCGERDLLTAEKIFKWYNLSKSQMENDWHKFLHVTDWNAVGMCFPHTAPAHTPTTTTLPSYFGVDR